MENSGVGKEGGGVDVGARLRMLRDERDISMRALARRSGLSANALSMIERGLTSPSVSTLTKLATALEVPVTAFFRLEPPRSPVVLTRAADRAQISLPNATWEGLGGEGFSGRVEPFIITLEPGGSSTGSEGVIHTGQELALCLEGSLEYDVSGKTYQLEAGDCLMFAAQLPHRFRNPGKTNARVVLVLTGFGESERPSEYHTDQIAKK